MLNCSELCKGNKCLYKGWTLFYQQRAGTKTPYYVFHTIAGTEKRLSKASTERDVWKEVFPEDLEAIATPTKD